MLSFATGFPEFWRLWDHGRVRLLAVLFGILLLAVTLYWTFAYFRRRWRR